MSMEQAARTRRMDDAYRNRRAQHESEWNHLHSQRGNGVLSTLKRALGVR